MNWHDNVFFGLHYDQHAKKEDTELGGALTHEHLRERLLRVKPDWVQCDCKGHPGWTSWPTMIGSTSPGVKKDALRIYRDVTRELGIKLGMHFSSLWDARAIELHPDWANVDATGKRNDKIVCQLGPYRQQLMIPHMLEIINTYGVDGFWVDGECWAVLCCWCERCTAEFRKRTGIEKIPTEAAQPHWDQWRAFHRQLFVEHVTEYTNAVHARKKDCLVVSSWMYSAMQPDPVTTAPVDYLSGDWTKFFGPERILMDARGQATRQRPWELMLWWNSRPPKCPESLPWNQSPLTHLCQEAAEILSLGGAVMLYIQPQRDGWLAGWAHDRAAHLAQFCRARKAFCFQTQTVPQAAVLHLASHYYATNPHLFHIETGIPEIEGALHALLETQRPTDLLFEDGVLNRLAGHKLVVAPEQTRLRPELITELEKFAHNGGQVILSGAHLSRECPSFVGADPAGEPTGEIKLPVGTEAAVAVGGPWQVVIPRKGTKALVHRLSGWEPVEHLTKDVVVTQRKVGRGAIVAIHGPVFRDYYHGHYPQLREFLRLLIESLKIDWLLKVNAPSQIEVVARQKDSRLLVNLVNRGAAETLSHTHVMTEGITPVRNVVLRIKRTTAPKSVTWQPDGTELHWSHNGRVLRVKVPRVDIHGVVVVE